jgi:glucose/arabinose dehydrogenase
LLLASGCTSSGDQPDAGDGSTDDGGAETGTPNDASNACPDTSAGEAQADAPGDDGPSPGDDGPSPGDDGPSPGADADSCAPAYPGWDGSASGMIAHPCDLPGSLQFTPSGKVVVGGGTVDPHVSFLTLPTGFCVHYFGKVNNARQVRFAPGGELFVASPTGSTTGGGPGGKAAIIVLPDDNLDGLADAPITFLSGLPQTQGLLFANGAFYYQDNTKIMRVPYVPGDRLPSGVSQTVANITIYADTLHWPKTLDIADDGKIYVGNGGTQGAVCTSTQTFEGGILEIDGSPCGGVSPGVPWVSGLRNPIAVRCSRGHNLCFGVELAKDYSAMQAGREKLFVIHQGDDWGFPCCATKNTPYTDVSPTPNCSMVAAESSAFLIGDTPFGLDFEPGQWPAPWKGNVFVTTHGAAGSWSGARVVAIAVDPVTGMPQNGSNLSGTDTGAMVDFLTGWDDGSHSHGRPAAVTFAPDGRLFLTNDNNGDIVWIAPLSL